MSHWIFSAFSLNVKLYHRFSQNQFFPVSHVFSNIIVSLILTGFASNLIETQLLGMMRAFCCSYFNISAICVRIHNLETQITIFCVFNIFFSKSFIC